MTAFRAACIQTRASDDVAENIREVGKLVREAAARGAHFIATPENATLMAANAPAKLARSFPEAEDPALPAFSDLARELKIWLSLGSIATRLDAEKTANRSFLFSPDGGIAARYNKIHLFDVEVAEGETYRESATVTGGDRAVLADTPWGRMGLTVCYDIRFPHLYRRLALAGAFAFTIPSAFTVPTGQAHWHVLLRARAIENGAFVIAPAQGGAHAGGRRTYGHSLIVGPWGEVLAESPGDEPGVILAGIDPLQSARARARMPSLTQDRPFDGP
ncbi:MAG: amidohydrolase [Alphaproteobacteria bacterium 64-11]|nr:carbon-nitrogen hydrolase family protein [Alphaproteobacteria bacterium]OJU09568.1 MAG: amidohydrolase [Alphaproteobacteria bacterium 64-11]